MASAEAFSVVVARGHHLLLRLSALSSHSPPSSSRFPPLPPVCSIASAESVCNWGASLVSGEVLGGEEQHINEKQPRITTVRQASLMYL